jgi:hypothetical protein
MAELGKKPMQVEEFMPMNLESHANSHVSTYIPKTTVRGSQILPLNMQDAIEEVDLDDYAPWISRPTHQ